MSEFRLNPKYTEAISTLVNRSPYFSLISMEIKVNYLAPVQKGKVVAKGRCIKMGRTLALGEAYINSAEGNLIAHGTATMMIIPDLKVEGQDKLPPKLI